MDKAAAQRGAALARRARRGEGDGPHRQLDIGRRCDDGGVVAAQLKNAALELPGAGDADLAAHAGRAGRADQPHRRVLHQVVAKHAPARQHRGDAGMLRRRRGQHALEQPVRGQRAQRRLLRRLPQHAVAAHQRQRRVPRPHRHREIEGRDHAAQAVRVPGLAHRVLRALRGDGQPVQLARQAHGEVADIDHLLHLAQPFLQDLAGFQRHQPAERGLVLAQHLAVAPHDLPARRCRQQRPGALRRVRACGQRIGLRRRAGRHMADRLAVDRRAHRHRAGRRAVLPWPRQPQRIPAGCEFLRFHTRVSCSGCCV
ncbi:hypothetical protein D9M69_395540 [compost metagenome]